MSFVTSFPPTVEVDKSDPTGHEILVLMQGEWRITGRRPGILTSAASY